MPKNLDDIVRKNRDQLSLQYANSADLSRLNEKILSKNYKGTLEDVFLYKRITPLSSIQPICAVGYLSNNSFKNPYHTSQVIALDLDQYVLGTASGSFYKVESFANSDKTNTDLLLHICHVAHHDGWGPHFGIAEINY